MNLAPELLDALAAHAALEQRNGLCYQSLYQAARADAFEGFAKGFKNDAIGEFGHAQNWLKYIAKYNVRLPAMQAIESVMPASTVAEMVEQAAELERATEASMERVLSVAEGVRDGAAVEWISSKLTDQQKERKQAEDFSARIGAAAGEPGCLTLIDRMLERGEWK